MASIPTQKDWFEYDEKIYASYAHARKTSSDKEAWIIIWYEFGEWFADTHPFRFYVRDRYDLEMETNI